jgi:flagellar motor protein MotB
VADESPSDDVPAWIVTYSDMVTLLMTFFILIVTFASREPEKLQQMLTSIVGGKKGTGAAGPVTTDREKQQILVRLTPPRGQPTRRGAEIPPTYSELALPLKDMVHKNVEEEIGTLQDSYELQLSKGALFTEVGISSAGWAALTDISKQMATLPYAIQVQVDDGGDIKRASQVYQFFFTHGGIDPRRLSIAVSSGGVGTGDVVRLIFQRLP